MNTFRVAYRVVRENSSEIYKGFGFKHLSDVTQYYVHPDNQSYKGTTTLCQPIGEAVILFASLLQAMKRGNIFGDFLVSKDRKSVFLEFTVPEDYRVNGVTDRRIYKYRALSEGMDIKMAAYDVSDLLLPGNMEHLRPLYKLLPSFMVLLGREIDENTEYRTTIYNRYKINIRSYNSRFAQILKAQVSEREEKFRYGSGITSKRLGDLKKRYWYRNVQGQDVPDMAVLLLIDGSGSMRGARRKAAMHSAVILHEVLKQQNITHAVVEHRAGFDEPEIDVNILPMIIILRFRRRIRQMRFVKSPGAERTLSGYLWMIPIGLTAMSSWHRSIRIWLAAMT